MNLAHLFVPLPSTADETWARLHAFTTEWWRAPGIREGLRSADLNRAEARLKIKLPSALRNAYCFFGRYPEVTRGQVNLVEPEDLAIREDVLTVFVDEHAVARWGIRRADLPFADPPVVVKIGHEGQERSARWEPSAPRFTAYFTESALLQATESARYINWMETAAPITMPPELARMSTGAVVRAMREATLYGGDDMLVVVDSPPSIFAVGVAAPTESAYQRVIGLFPGARWRQHADSVDQPDYGDVLADLEHVIRMLRAEARSKKH